MINQLDTPVIFIIFNRPDLTQKVFSTIKDVKPRKLFVIADGARHHEEIEKCQKTRQIIDQVDWDCEVYKNFSEINLTSPIRCSSGISWAFDHVEQAIILEDDCLPCQSFFYFCEELLNYYSNDARVMHISGNNFQYGQSRTPYSYYFSQYNHNWGWATWKRAWTYFDLKMESLEQVFQEDLFNFIFDDKYEKEYWHRIFKKCVYENDPHWDYAWSYACWLQSGLSILPNQNLVSNIGFRNDATRTKNANVPYANLPTREISKIYHPPFVVRQKEADQYTFDNHFGGLSLKINSTLYGKIKYKLLQLKMSFLKKRK